MTWTKDLQQGTESLKCRWDIVPYTRGKGLDCGCGPVKPFPHFIGIDNRRDTALFGIPINPDIVGDIQDLSMFVSESMDFVFSSHTLEHFKDHEKTLTEWWRVIKPEGTLVLYLPHADFYPHIGADDSNPDHAHDFLPQDIIDAMRKIGSWDLLVNEERNEKDEYSFLQVYKKLPDQAEPRNRFEMLVHEESWKLTKPGKTCAIVRFGAYGDGVQSSSILPALKDRGYHITFYTTPRCFEVLKHEPLIDRVVLQDTEQVPNHLLGDYWDHLKTKYDKFINLSESVETQFLVTPDRVSYNWPRLARHAQMNLNYGYMLHKIAGVPYIEPESRFVVTEEEKAWARAQISETGGNPVILWVLSGSAIHKVYPHMDDVIEQLFKAYPTAKIITVGDEKCRDVIEKPWRDNQRIIRRSGIWGIRQTISVAQQCDIVVGPETGVLNAVAMDNVTKIVMLSHSSVENLTRDWRNTVSLFSIKTPCAPCHKMIYKWEQCNRDDETGTAKCMADISADEVFNAIQKAIIKMRPMQLAAA